MSHAAFKPENRRIFAQATVMREYFDTSLQDAEAVILARHSADIENKRVLDIGCGAGRTTAFLLPLSTHYVGVDYAVGMVETCRARYPGIDFLECDVRDMDRFAAGAFDFSLFSFNGLDCIDHEGRMKALAEIHRVLQSKGLFVFSSHNRNWHDPAPEPRLSFHLNPYRQLRALAGFLISLRNHRRNRAFQVEAEEYAIINDRAHRWALLLYYIRKEAQMRQLQRAGFDLIEMYDTLGNRLESDTEDSHSYCIYYVARKRA